MENMNLKLFKPGRINGMDLKNRFIRSALWMKGAAEDGGLTDSLLKTYDDLAAGGVGLIITGYAYISTEEKPNPGMLGIYDDSFIPEYRRLTERVHRRGTKIALQIVFGGSQNTHPDGEGMNLLAPSAVENRLTGLTPREADREDILRIVGLFGNAAARAKEAGFDAVQIHAGHGYFLSSFLTPYFNRRNDEYNGDIHDRARIIYETYNEIRSRVGKNFPVMIKLNHHDFMEEGEGLVLEEALEVFKRLDDMGMDHFEVTGVNESSGRGLRPARTGITSREKESYFAEAAERIAKVVKAPVALMGGNRTPSLMEEILRRSEIEYVSLARPLLCEPDLIRRWEENPVYASRCISCNRCWTTTPNSCVLLRKAAEVGIEFLI